LFPEIQKIECKGPSTRASRFVWLSKKIRKRFWINA